MVNCKSGKFRHPQKHLAVRYAQNMQRKFGATRAATDVYYCHDCDGFHIGHKPGFRARKLRKK